MAFPRVLSLFMALLLAAPSLRAAGPSCDRVWKTSPSPLPGAFERAAEAHRKIRPYLQGELRVPHLRHETGLSAKGLRLLQAIYHKPVQVLSPISTQRILPWEAPANKVMMKLWRNRNYEPTRDEWAALEKYRAADVFRDRQSFLGNHPNWHRFRKTLNALTRTSLLTFFILHSHFAEEARDNAQSVSDYLTAPDGDEPRVEVLNETTPFPHVAIRIGRRVYSYGVERMTVMTLSEYLLESRLTAEAEKSKLRRFGEKHLPRSIQSIELKLGAEEVRALRRELESHAGKAYRNMTMVNDCASMIVRALTKTTSVHVPWKVDMSPAAVFSYLIILKLKDDSRIGTFRQITEDGVEASVGLGARNVWINSMESKFWIATMMFNLPLRVLMNLSLEDDEIQDFDENQKKIIEEFRAEVSSSVKDSLEIRGLEVLLGELLEKPAVTAGEGEKMESLIRETVEILKTPHAEALADPLETPARLTAEYSLAALDEIRFLMIHDLKQKMKGNDL